MGKRAAGTGSIWSEARKGHEVWVGQVRVAGCQYQRTLGRKRRNGSDDGLTRAMAERRLREVRDQLEAEVPNDPDSQRAPLTLAEIGQTHIERLEAVAGRERATVEDYRIYLNRHLIPYFSDIPVSEITSEDVENFIVAQRKNGLAPATILNHVNFLNSIFVYALKRSLVDRNPVAQADKPRIPVSKDLRFLAVEEIEAILCAMPDHEIGKTDRAIVLTAAMTGMRSGEIRALRWRDIDWQAGLIRIRKNMKRGGIEGETKSRRSTRTVPLSDRVAHELDEHFRRSHYTSPEDRVFCHPHTGNPRDAGKMRDSLYGAMRTAELGEKIGRNGGITFHSLRHTFATRMAAAGAPIRAIQEWLGHADIQMTMIYADYAPDSTNGRIWAQRAFSTGHLPEMTAQSDC